uniref:BPTI/Kunitz inhibitor domain-containing protein n=1 Tax=Amphimedon queenslandica TaxID=400682 RepID=A0A1X7V8V2_AMPQE
MALLLLLTAVILGVLTVLSQCTGSKICLLYKTGNNEKGSPIATKSSYFWYDPLVKNCVLLEEDCSIRNENSTFTSLENCRNICKVPLDPVKNCNDDNKLGNCDEDLPPTSTRTTNHSSKRNYMSIVVAVSGSVGVIALVAIMIATAFSLKRRKTTVNRRKKLDNMLTMLSDPNGNSSSDDDLFGDDPEDDNLFDRLERQHL